MLSLFPLVSSHWLTVTVVITEPNLSPFLLLFAAVWSCHSGDGDSAPTHSEDISGHYAWVAPSRHHHVTLGPELRHDNNPIWMGHGIRHGHVLDIWPCHACCYCRALFCPGTWVDDLFFTITLTVVLPVTISRFVSQQRLWLLLPITGWHYIIHRQCAASSQLKLKIKLVQL